MKYFLQCILLILPFFRAAAQGPYRVVSVPVTRNGAAVREPWTGGMDSPEISSCDLNQDGIPDLFIFDRVNNRVLTYTGTGTNIGTDSMYTYAPQYEGLFPADLSNWALIKDYNNDGIPDIFTNAATTSGPGTRVFKGSIQQGLLHFTLVSSALQYMDAGFTPNIPTNALDIPAFVDVNGDGYLDLLSYNLSGTNLTYYQNQAGQYPDDPSYIDSFKYDVITSCWGNVMQDLQTNSMSLNVSCKGGTDEQQQPNGLRHSGNSLYTLTDPVYNDIDILNGNIGFSNLFLLRNCGGNEIANVCSWDSVYPACDVPMYMPVYPAAFGVNISSTQSKDLLLAPSSGNPYIGTAGVGRNVDNITYYKTTDDTACWFAYQNDSFLVHYTLDFGSGSKPLFYDFDGDGLTDIVVANFGYYQPGLESQLEPSSLAFYRNTGTATAPTFTEVSEDYDSLSKYNLPVMDFAFGDLNGDGKNDLLVGDLYGYLYYFQNTASTGSSFPAMTASEYFGIQVDNYAAPFIYDVNGDSLNDLVVGMQNGTLSYFWNFGTKTNPQFSPDSVNANFGNVNVVNGNVFGYSQPYIRPDSAGNLMLYVGSLSGAIYEYVIDQTKLRGGSFTCIDSNYIPRNRAANSSVSIADINSDGKLEYLTGNAAGGLMMFSDSLWDPGLLLGIPVVPGGKTQMDIYPNPAKDYFFCAAVNGQFNQPVTEVYNVLGEKLDLDAQLTGGKVLLNSSRVSNGFYIIKINDSGKTYTGKVFIVH